MQTALENMQTNISSVNTAPFSPPSAGCDSNPATHPEKGNIAAEPHMPSLVDVYRSQSGNIICPRTASQAPRYGIAQQLFTCIFDRGEPLACSTHRPSPLFQQLYL
jgi:hypothetical protein